MSIKTLIRIVANTILGIILVLVWLHFVNINEILATLKTVDLLYVLPMMVLIFSSLCIRAYRLKYFLQPFVNINYWQLLFLNGTALMLNFLIPIRAGDLAKGVYLAGHYKLPMAKSIIWIFLDRFLDFITAVVLSVLLLMFVPNQLPNSFIFVLVGLSFGLILMVYLMVYRVNVAQRVFKALRLFESLYRFFLTTFTIFKRKPKEVLVLVLFTFLAYASDTLIWYFTFISLGSYQELVKLYLVQLLSALTYLIPAAPGYVGSAEASGLLVFTGIFGIDVNLASSVTVIFHIVTAVFILIFGSVSIYFLKFDLGGVLKKVFRK